MQNPCQRFCRDEKPTSVGRAGRRKCLLWLDVRQYRRPAVDGRPAGWSFSLSYNVCLAVHGSRHGHRRAVRRLDVFCDGPGPGSADRAARCDGHAAGVGHPQHHCHGAVRAGALFPARATTTGVRRIAGGGLHLAHRYLLDFSVGDLQGGVCLGVGAGAPTGAAPDCWDP